jgi:hypothetical protein
MKRRNLTVCANHRISIMCRCGINSLNEQHIHHAQYCLKKIRVSIYVFDVGSSCIASGTLSSARSAEMRDIGPWARDERQEWGVLHACAETVVGGR